MYEKFYFCSLNEEKKNLPRSQMWFTLCRSLRVCALSSVTHIFHLKIRLTNFFTIWLRYCHHDFINIDENFFSRHFQWVLNAIFIFPVVWSKKWNFIKAYQEETFLLPSHFFFFFDEKIVFNLKLLKSCGSFLIRGCIQTFFT